MPKYEVEIRGHLNKHQFKKLKSFLDKNAKVGQKQNQVAIFMDGEHNKNFGSIKDSKMRLALQINEGQSKLKVKLGHVSLTGRREIQLNLGKTPSSEIFAFLETFGFSKGAVRPVYRQDYYYQGIEIALKNKCIFGDHFELETSVNQKSELKNSKKKLLDFANKFNLDVLTEKEYLTIILDIYNKYPPIFFKNILKDYHLR